MHTHMDNMFKPLKAYALNIETHICIPLNCPTCVTCCCIAFSTELHNLAALAMCRKLETYRARLKKHVTSLKNGLGLPCGTCQQRRERMSVGPPITQHMHKNCSAPGENNPDQSSTYFHFRSPPTGADSIVSSGLGPSQKKKNTSYLYICTYVYIYIYTTDAHGNNIQNIPRRSQFLLSFYLMSSLLI